MWRQGFALLLLALVCLPAQAAPFVSGVRFGQHPDKLRIVLDVGEKAGFQPAVFEDPWRVVVSFDGMKSAHLPATLSGKGALPVLRYGADEKTDSLVFETQGPVQILDSFFLPGEGEKSPRIVLDIASLASLSSGKNVLSPAARGGESTSSSLSQSSAGDAAALSAIIGGLVDGGKGQEKTSPPEQEVVPAPAGQASMPPPAPRARKVVVLDPGHGGRDPGAIGADGTFEKTITLAVAKSLRTELEKSGKYKVLLTREDDRTLRLSDRVKFARNAKADLFVSLHADSIEAGQASGASFYTLSDKASDGATARLVARENRADIIAGLDLSEESADVAGILIDLAMRETQNQSHLLSRQVVSAMTSAGITLLENPQRSAGFAVLKAPDVPSLLVEMGYVSSRKEVALLKNPKHQHRLAGALHNGLDGYFSWLEGVSGR
ncbi:MAG: hypothetical protein A2018_07665 [Alphaproteobacteria bacterium GWF2_58_20]|nr:MAG: hypothetical protein A2018_07665 [Alphaproteobacteria bacterium GWF2_58_20]